MPAALETAICLQFVILLLAACAALVGWSRALFDFAFDLFRYRMLQEPRSRPGRAALRALIQRRPHGRWTLDNCGWSPDEFTEFIRFTKVKAEIREFMPFLHLDRVQWRNGNHPGDEEALCILLFRLSTPCRLKDISRVFGRSRSYCSYIINDLVEFLGLNFRDHLAWDRNRLTLARLRYYSMAILQSAGVRNLWGFIDGTMRPFCRPTERQGEWYAGGKYHTHGFRMLVIMTPDGLLSSVTGPHRGPVGDWRMWQLSGVEQQLRWLMSHLPERMHIYLYGDNAFWPAFGIIGPHQDGVIPLTPAERAMNLVMSALRMTAEWGFAILLNQWAFNHHRYGLQLNLSPVGGYYLTSALLTNIMTCQRGRNMVSDHFDCRPPSLAQYFASMEVQARIEPRRLQIIEIPDDD